jgi:hypothetical protein
MLWGVVVWLWMWSLVSNSRRAVRNLVNSRSADPTVVDGLVRGTVWSLTLASGVV